MFKFYIGQLNLKNPQVMQVANKISAEGEVYIKQNKMQGDNIWFDRFVEQVLFWYADPTRIRNPITVLLAHGYLQGVHPGTSRFLACHLANVDSMPALAVSHVDELTETTAAKYFVSYKETDDVFFNTEPPCKYSFQPKTRKEFKDNWWLDESVEDVNARILKNHHANLHWVNSKGETLYQTGYDLSADSTIITINQFVDFWPSLISYTKL